MASIFFKAWTPDNVVSMTRTKVKNDLNAAAAVGVQAAQRDTPRDTGFAANTVEIVQLAETSKRSVIWGNITADYYIWLEIGARGRAGRHMLRNSMQDAGRELHSRGWK